MREHGRSWDFFVSYSAADREWAEWIAWQLEETGYRVLIQAWDFVPGAHWMGRMADGVRGSRQVIAVLSHTYLNSVYGRAEWESAFRTDPDGQTRKVIPIRIQDCPHPTLLDAVVSFDLFGLEADTARTHLLRNIKAALNGRAKPIVAPSFPGGTLIPPAATSPDAAPNPDFPTSATLAPAVVNWNHPTLLGTPLEHTGHLNSVVFFPNGRTLATHAGHDVQVWDVSDPSRSSRRGDPLHYYTEVFSVALGPALAIASGGGMALYDVSKLTRPTLLHKKYEPGLYLLSVQFSPDGRIIVTHSVSAVQLWDATDQSHPRLITPQTRHTGPMHSVVFSPNGRILATRSGDKTTKWRLWLWDATDAAHPTPLAAPETRHTIPVGFSPDGRILATCSAVGTQLWDVIDPSRPTPLGAPLTGNHVKSLAYSPDGRTLAIGHLDGTVQLWTTG